MLLTIWSIRPAPCSAVCGTLCVRVSQYARNNSKPQLPPNVRAVSLNQCRPFLFQISSATAWKSIDLHLSLQRAAVFAVTNLSVASKWLSGVFRFKADSSSTAAKASNAPSPPGSADNLHSLMLILSKCQLWSTVCSPSTLLLDNAALGRNKVCLKSPNMEKLRHCM